MDAARTAAKNSAAVVNDMLGRLVTLDSALIGGGVVISKGEVFPVWWSALVLACLLTSLAVSLWYLMPRRGRFAEGCSLDDLEADRVSRNNALHCKADALYFAAAAMLLGMGVALLGVLLRSLGVI